MDETMSDLSEFEEDFDQSERKLNPMQGALVALAASILLFWVPGIVLGIYLIR